MGVWIIPYMFWVPRDSATASNFGASISHATEDKRVCYFLKYGQKQVADIRLGSWRQPK